MLLDTEIGTTGGGGLFPLNPNGQRDQPTMEFGFGVDGGEAVGGFVVVGGGVVVMGAAPFRRVILPTRSVRVIDCPAGA